MVPVASDQVLKNAKTTERSPFTRIDARTILSMTEGPPLARFRRGRGDRVAKEISPAVSRCAADRRYFIDATRQPSGLLRAERLRPTEEDTHK
jgi:hypothetical protein